MGPMTAIFGGCVGYIAIGATTCWPVCPKPYPASRSKVPPPVFMSPFVYLVTMTKSRRQDSFPACGDAVLRPKVSLDTARPPLGRDDCSWATGGSRKAESQKPSL